MALRGKHGPKLSRLLDLLSREDDWLILVTADPDAMASAMALKRIMSRRTGEVAIARTNSITRPDNLAMVRYLHIPMIPWDDTLCSFFNRFALVDSQPHHNAAFAGIPFSIVVDHHPLVVEHPVEAPYTDVDPRSGSTSTMFTEYLRTLGIRPGSLLATALQYGIRTDTATFTRKVSESDMRAYQYLAGYADASLLTRIMRSEYLPSWLKYFSRAFASLHACGRGHYVYLGLVENPDILVVIADFFTRVHGLVWIAVCGVYCPTGCSDNGGTVVVIFRGDGRTCDVGNLAEERLSGLGFAGGHKAMARAEFPVTLTEGRNIEIFVFKKLEGPQKAKRENGGIP